jgi:hypothetical protein
MIPNAPLLSILYFSQVVNGVLLPIVLIFMLVIINDKSVMGEHVNSRIYNYITGNSHYDDRIKRRPHRGDVPMNGVGSPILR